MKKKMHDCIMHVLKSFTFQQKFYYTHKFTKDNSFPAKRGDGCGGCLKYYSGRRLSEMYNKVFFF